MKRQITALLGGRTHYGERSTTDASCKQSYTTALEEGANDCVCIVDAGVAMTVSCTERTYVCVLLLLPADKAQLIAKSKTEV